MKIWEISGHTKLICLLGSPVLHSISPLIHNKAFARLGLDYRYLAFDVKKDNLDEAAKGLRALGVAGFNLTMPLKTAILKYTDDLTPAAELAGACNTVYVRGGKWIGHTSDGAGFMRSLTEAGYDITGGKMTVLGAGGAASAIIAQAALDGVGEIDIFRRDRADASERTRRYAVRLAGRTSCALRVLDIADAALLKKSIAESAVLVNATNIGMAPRADECPVPNESFLHPGLIVEDIIYNPRRTLLSRMAEQSDCRVVDGANMLLYQAASSFECWTGMGVPPDVIESIRKDIGL